MKVIASLIVGCLVATGALAGDSVPPGRVKAATELLDHGGPGRPLGALLMETARAASSGMADRITSQDG